MLAATVFDLDGTLADSATTWTLVIGTVAARHGHAWTRDDRTAIQGTGTTHWSGYLADRCPDLTPESAVAECVEGMVAAVEFGRFGLLPGAARLVTAAAERGPVGLVSASPGATSGRRSPRRASPGTCARSSPVTTSRTANPHRTRTSWPRTASACRRTGVSPSRTPVPASARRTRPA